jgi:hypothetical protein
MSVSEGNIRIFVRTALWKDVSLNAPYSLPLASMGIDKATRYISAMTFSGRSTQIDFDPLILTNTPSQAHLAVVDGVLLTVAGWLRELEQAVVPCGEGMAHLIPVEYL